MQQTLLCSWGTHWHTEPEQALSLSSAMQQPQALQLLNGTAVVSWAAICTG